MIEDVTNLPPLLRIEIYRDPLIERFDALTGRYVQYVVGVYLVEGGMVFIWEGSEYEDAVIAAENLQRRHPGAPIDDTCAQVRH
jgi:hypothetical protein